MNAPVLTPALAIGLVLGTLSLAKAEFAPQTMRGTHASWRTTVQTYGGPATIDLEFEPSSLLNRARTVLSLQVDGSPRATVRLQERRRLHVHLGTLPAGFHQVELRGYLVVDEDPCLRVHDEQAWIRIDAFELTTPKPPGTQSVYATLAGLSGEGAYVDGWAPETPDEVGAEIDAWITLHRWGASPGDDIRLHLSLGEVDLGALAEVHAIEGGLAIWAPTALALAKALRRLRDPDFAAHCDGPSCAIGPVRFQPEEEGESASEAYAWTLEDHGYRNGWVPRGAGNHVLTVAWDRPATWTPRAYPTFVMEVRASQTLARGTSITLTLNEIPLETWSLDPSSGTLSARIPEQFWNEARWEFAVHARLETTGEECRREDTTWMHLSPSSGLTLPRTERDPGGIASFEAQPELVWNEAALDARRTLALVLATLADDARYWRWRPEDIPCEEACVRAGALPSLELRGSSWIDRTGALGLPVIPADNTVALERDGQELRVHSVGAPALPEAVQLGGLEGTVALFRNEAWFAFGDPPAVSVREVEAEAPAMTIASDAHIDTTWINVLSGALALTALSLPFWRRRRA